MKNSRGFEFREFRDDYGLKCSMQESSAAEPKIWFGVDDPELMIEYQDAQRLGIEVPENVTESNCRRVMDYPLPDGVTTFSRMHLTREMVAEIIPALQHFVDYGYLPSEDE